MTVYHPVHALSGDRGVGKEGSNTTKSKNLNAKVDS